MNEQDIDIFKSMKYYVHFTDGDFRKFTSTNMISNDILNLLLETSRVEFKIVYPCGVMRSDVGICSIFFLAMNCTRTLPQLICGLFLAVTT